jgi:hypothetical protein
MYKLNKDSWSNQIVSVNKENNDGSGISFPLNTANTDYAKFKKDLANGAELQDAEGNVIDGIAYLATLES